ncbi:MAG: phosphatase PAP2 family protein [Anaerolineales bacterium]
MMRRLLKWDAAASSALRVAEKPGPLRTLAMIFAHSGDSWFWGAGLIALWLAGNSAWKRWAFYELFWISALAALVMTLKFTIRRRRPEGEWGKIYRNTDPHSFPSGHAARAFLIALLAGWLGPENLALILWIWAPLVSLARVAMGVHYLSDVVAGALVGLLTAWLAWQASPALIAALTGFSPWPLW